MVLMLTTQDCQMDSVYSTNVFDLCIHLFLDFSSHLDENAM